MREKEKEFKYKGKYTLGSVFRHRKYPNFVVQIMEPPNIWNKTTVKVLTSIPYKLRSYYQVTRVYGFFSFDYGQDTGKEEFELIYISRSTLSNSFEKCEMGELLYA